MIKSVLSVCCSAAALCLSAGLATSVSAGEGFHQDIRSNFKHYHGSSTFKEVNQEQDLNYLLQEAPTAADGSIKKRTGMLVENRAFEKNYIGSPTYKQPEDVSGLSYLLEKEPTAAGRKPVKSAEPSESDVRYRFKNYLGPHAVGRSIKPN